MFSDNKIDLLASFDIICVQLTVCVGPSLTCYTAVHLAIYSALLNAI